jgi:outer membrane protein assembly factor BamB
VAEVDGRTQVIVSATKLIRSYDAKTGDLIWQCGGQVRNVIPSPVLGFGMVFCTSGYQGSSLQAIRLAGSKGDLSGTDAVAWQVNKGTPYVSSPLLYGNRIYVFSVLTPKLSCYEARTGKPLFTEQALEGINQVYASPVGVADRVYCPGRNGVTVVIRNADTFEVLATNKLDDGFDASPAVIGDELYMRGHKSLYCIAGK